MNDRDIRIRVQVKDDGSVVLQTIGDKGGKSMEKIRKGSGGAAAATKKFADSAAGAVAAVTSLAAAVGVGFVTRDIVTAGIGMERMTTAMLAAVDSSEAATAEFAFLSDEADRLGLNLERAGGAFSQLMAASKGTTLQGQGARDIFTAVSEAATVLSLSAYETEGALRAINQMVSKGNVQAEELRGQLGERLPGAFQIAARAMGVTTMELNDMLERGEVMAEDFLPKFAIELRKTFSDQVPGALDNTRQQLNRFNTELFKLKAEFAGGGFLDGLLDVVDGLSAVLKDQTFRDGLADLSKHVGLFLADLKDVPKDAVAFIDEYGTSIKAVGGFLLTVTAAQWAFNRAVKANPYLLAGSALFWVAGWFKDYTDEVKKATDATNKLNREYAALTGAPPPPLPLEMMASHGQEPAGSDEFLAAVAREDATNSQLKELPSHGVPNSDKQNKKTAPPGTSTEDPLVALGLIPSDTEKQVDTLLAAVFGDSDDKSEDANEKRRKKNEAWAEDAARAAETAQNALAEVTRAALPEQERAVYDVHQAYADLSAKVEQLSIIGEISKEVADDLKANLSDRMNKDLDDLSKKGEKTFGEDLKNAVTGWGAGFSSELNDMVWSAEASFGDIAESFGRMITQMFIQQQIVGPLMNSLGAGGASLFGGGRASGGEVSPGKMYEVAEEGIPELLNIGNRTFLMTGSQGGHVVPPAAMGSGAGGGTAPQSGGASEIRVTIENKGTEKHVVSATPRFDIHGMVVSIVLDDLESNGPINQAMGGAL